MQLDLSGVGTHTRAHIVLCRLAYTYFLHIFKSFFFFSSFFCQRDINEGKAKIFKLLFYPIELQESARKETLDPIPQRTFCKFAVSAFF